MKRGIHKNAPNYSNDPWFQNGFMSLCHSRWQPHGNGIVIGKGPLTTRSNQHAILSINHA